MKPFHLFALVTCLVLLSCGDSPKSVYLSHELLFRDQYIGEYLKIEDSDHLITVSRQTPTRSGLGLVRIDWRDKSIEILDPSAIEAKNIFISHDEISFLDRDRIAWLVAGERRELLSHSAKRLFGFESQDRFWLFSFEDAENQTKTLCLSKTDDSWQEIPIDGRVLKQIGARLWVQSQEGIMIINLSSCEDFVIESNQVILPKVYTQYLEVYQAKTKTHIAFLDEGDGCLKHIVFNENHVIESRQTVDGKPDDSYVGMDIQFFEWESQLGLLYLDGWELSPKIALFDGSKWRTHLLPAFGASGFYNQVIRVEGNELIAAWHAFRTAFSNDDVSFEDLVLARIRLDF
jgi:hypothetical protein